MAEGTKERVDSCLILTSILKKGKTKLFHKYQVFLPTKQLEKKEEIFESKLALFRIKGRS